MLVTAARQYCSSVLVGSNQIELRLFLNRESRYRPLLFWFVERSCSFTVLFYRWRAVPRCSCAALRARSVTGRLIDGDLILIGQTESSTKSTDLWDAEKTLNLTDRIVRPCLNDENEFSS